ADLNDAGGSGANNFFQISSLNQLNGAGGVTISAWVNTETQGSSAYNGIFMTRDFNNQSNNSWGLAFETTGGDHLDSRVDGPGIDSANGLLSPGAGWVHVALTWDGATQTHRQFVNGVQTNSASTAGDGGLSGGTIAGASNGPWFIGYDNCCVNTRDLDGQIDDAAVWNQALTPAEIKQVYDAGLNNTGAANAFASSAALGAIQQGLVGSWNMDQATGTQAAADSINNNHAALTNMDVNGDWVSGQIGRALDFDGSNDQAVISGISQIDGSPEMTISTWVNSDGGNNGWEGIFQHRSAANNNQNGLMFPGSGPADDLQGRINNSNFGDGTTPAGAAPTGTWVHVVQTYKAGEFHRIYIDGVLVQEDVGASAGNIISDGAWRFGNDVCCGGRFYDGQIDDTGLWSRALSGQEIEAIRQAGLNGISHTRAFIPEDTPLQQSLVGHWTFDQARFTPTAFDSLGGADAAMSGMDAGSDWVAGQIGGALQFDGGNDQAVI
ncbi:MAG: LamG domain-containing protein, partial [Planctomycetales bacterium]|nr:LamG domain-containing protein [Planctomycetales bacterium]